MLRTCGAAVLRPYEERANSRPQKRRVRHPVESVLLSEGLLEWPVAPEILAVLGQGVNGIEVFVAARERFRVIGFDAGAIILGPVGDAQLAVVFFHLVNPALSDERNIANHARSG